MPRPLRAGLATLLLLCTAAPAFAQNAPPGPPGQGDQMPFDQRKQTMINRLNQEIAVLQRTAACIQAAMTQDALRGCMQEQREAVEQMRHRGMGQGQ